jgi:predicted aspartyl protease
MWRARLPAAVAFVALGAGCTVAQRGWPPPSFPPGNPTTVLPIIDPLHPGAVLVDARVRGTDGREWPVVAVADSGASETALPAALSSSLGLRQLARTRSEAAGHASVGIAVVEVPEVLLGDLAVRRVFAAAILLAPTVIVGQSILRHAPWEIAWDRGTLTLGATPWAEGGGVAAVPLRRLARYPADEIEVRVNGRPVRMLLDTGAEVSALPAEAAASLGLAAVPTKNILVGVAGVVPLTNAYFATLEIGGARIDGQRFVELPAGKTPLLGLDVLSRFDLLVVPGQRLLLRPRGDVRASAGARIRRWSWMPACASPGCARGRVERAGTAGRLELDIEAELPRAVRLVAGCAENGAPALTLVVALAGYKPGHVTTDVRPPGAGWHSPHGVACRELQILDVVPAPDLRSPSVDARLER